MNLSKARPGQRGALEVIVKRARVGEKETGIILPTGYGKRDLIILGGVTLFDLGLTSCNLVVNVNDNLRSQFIDETRFDAACMRYDLFRDDRPIKRIAIETAWPGIDFSKNGELFVDTTIQLINTWCTLFVDYADSMQHRSGRPLTMWLDECQFCSDANKWGETCARLLDAGVRIIGLTATGEREDGERAWGFRQHVVKSEPVEYKRPRMLPRDPTKSFRECKVGLYAGYRNHIELDPDFEWTYQKAWAENALCKMSVIFIDVEMDIIDPKNTEMRHRRLSDLSETEVRKVLPMVVQHPEFLRKAVEAGLKALRMFRGMADDCAALAFSMNDKTSDDRVNQHAGAITKVVKRLDPGLQLVVATTANDKTGDGPSGSKILKAFTDEKNPVGDMAIVKQMAGLGLDASRIKLILDFSTVRSPNAVIQRDNRATRPHECRGGTIITAIKVCPADCLSMAIYDKYYVEKGGAVIDDVELVGDDTVPVEEKERTLYIIRDVIPGNIHDTSRNVIGPEDIPAVNRFLDRFPEVARIKTLPVIAKDLKELYPSATVAPPNGNSVDTGDRITKLKNQIFELAQMSINYSFNKVTGRPYRSGSREDSELWGEISKKLWSDVKSGARNPGDNYKESNDLAFIEEIYSLWMDKVQRSEL